MNRIRNEKNILVPADKTSNYYNITPQQYETVMQDSVTAACTDQRSENTTNMEARKIADNLDLSDRIQVLAPKPAYVTLKDHKQNFRSHPTCRLINPSKREIGINSKKILERINTEVIAATYVNQWRNYIVVIDWFKGIETRPNSTFISFDIVNFYPSIDRQLQQKAIHFAKRFTTITPSEAEIIFQAKNTLLFHGNMSWQKATGDDLFDVTMGSYDGAET